MKYTKRIFSTVLAAVLLLSVMLTGCSNPKLIVGGTPDSVGTVAGQEIPTGEYLAYLYNTFNTMYYDQGLYYYEYLDMDPWTQEFTYGEGDTAQTVQLSEYITLQTKDTIVRQVALTQLLDKYGLSWIEEEEAEIDAEFAELTDNYFIDLGFTNERYIKSYKNLSLNERSLFLGLYGEGGERVVSEEELKKYYNENYVAYKTIPIALTDEAGKELDDAGKKKITDRLDGYLELYNEDKDFEMVMDTYNRDEATEEEKDSLEVVTDEDTRVISDVNDMTDDDLVEAIRSVEIGSAKVVTYKAGGTTPTAALIVRLDPNENEMFADYEEAVLISLKYEEFDAEVTAAAAKLEVNFDQSAIDKCKPENFAEAAE